MIRQSFEAMLSNDTDPWKVCSYLSKQPGIIKANVVTCDSIRVHFDESKLQEKIIIKMIGRCSNKKTSRNRTNNILHIKRKEQDAA